MSKNLIRITSMVILAVFLFSCIGSGIYNAFAETDQEIIERSRKEQQEAQAAIQQKTEEKYAALSILNELTEEIDALQTEVDELDATLRNYYAEIDIKNAEIKETEKRIEIQDDLLKKRLRAMDENGNVGILEVLFGANSFADFLKRMDTVRTVAEYDKTILDRYEGAKEEYEKQKAEIEAKKLAVESTKEQIENKKSEITVVQSQKQEEVDALSDLIAQYQADLAASKIAEAEANARINQDAANTAHITASYNFTSGALNYPFAGHYICTSPFGGRISPITGSWEGHSGVDIGAPYGTPILASSDGVVITSGFNTGGYGNYVVIDHGGGIYTLYAHASSLNVSSGQIVSAGQMIASVGSTGWSTGPHLHFEVRVNGSCVDPSGYIPVY